MKKLVLLAAMLTLCVAGMWADTQSDFNSSIKQYNTQIAVDNYVAASDAVARASSACAEVKNYEGAFGILANCERALGADNVRPDSLPEAFYNLAQARFELYDHMGNARSAQAQLQKMINLAEQCKSKSVTNRMLYCAAQYYYSINENNKGDQCISKLIKQFETEKDYSGADKAYQELIKKAVSDNDAELVEHTYANYMKWSDSVEEMNQDSELLKAKKEIDANEQTIAEKAKTLRGTTGLRATFITLFLIAIAALGVGVWFYCRSVAKNKRLHRSIAAANEQSEAKSAILHNMSSTMAPTLDKLPTDDPDVQNLRKYVERVGELSDVGNTTPKAPEELEDVNVEKFCQDIVDQIRPMVKEGVTIRTDINKGIIRIDADEVRKILMHLMENAAKYTPANGKITLSYKKRGAKVNQFTVSDSGPGIAKEKRETLFTAFSESTGDLSQGDKLGLPICALRAKKMNGTLELDTDGSIGSTFVLTIR